MILPVRKCYHTAKVGFILLIVVVIMYSFEHWRGSKRSAIAQTTQEEEYEKQILEDEARIVPGLGEGGDPAHLVGEAKKLGEESEKKLAINVYLSDRISYNRTLKDRRNPACERVVYDAELPSVSVILIFHNEPYSVVVRTIWSVLNSARRDRDWYTRANYVDRETGRTMTLGYQGQDPSSKYVYLKEIILVDDNSTLPELKGKLSHYVSTRLPPDLIRIVRLPDRIGITRARLAGADAARGDVLIFLDSHSEGNTDWLRPILQRIKENLKAVVTPIIDMIQQDTLQYAFGELKSFQVGGFTFMGHFTWIDVPEREKKRRGSDIAPTWSPTMAGGLFAINRQYFWEIGAYDEQMAGWGGENLEMSFRIWQCGGTLETIPCSRVGHVFRNFHPYGMPAHTDTHGINTARMAEVWMDDYAELFYLHRPDLRKSPKIGDVTHRRILREKLKCKSFQWYLDNIYREKFVPVRDVFGFGRFKNPSSGLCLDTLQHDGEATPLGVYPCHQRLEPTQYMALSLQGELRDEERCAVPQFFRSVYGNNKETEKEQSRRVLMVRCIGNHRGQKWRYMDSQLQHVESGLCLTTGRDAADPVTVSTCSPAPEQFWKIDYSDLNGFKMSFDNESSEQEQRLKRLRGQRRISRSLLSLPEVNHTQRSRKHKKRGRPTKNKFILKLVRSLNGTEEHLEADVYCQHRRLYPNNTFVRDLVSMLNAKNIKVVNNGRVFEHNRVRSASLSERDLEHEQVTEHVEEHQPGSGEQTRSLEQDERVSTSPETTSKKSHHKSKRKHKHDKNRASKSERHNHVEGRGDDSPQKRIIIEDFVEIKPLLPTESSPKKRKHARKESSVSPELESSTLRTFDWDKSEMEADTLEEVPYLSGEGNKKQQSSDENWPIQVSYLRHSSNKGGSRGRHNKHSKVSGDRQLQVDEVTEGKSKGPVKFVMRSNLTFDLGDELMRWRQRDRAEDEVANLLDDLVIPNITKEPSSSERESSEATTKQRQMDSSGSSESGGDK